MRFRITFLEFSRDFEAQADYLGVQYMYRAGYDPQAFITFFEKMQALEKRKPGLVAKAFSDHPQTPDRILHSQEEIARILPARDEYIVTTSEFDDVKARLARIENKRRLPTPRTRTSPSCAAPAPGRQQWPVERQQRRRPADPAPSRRSNIKPSIPPFPGQKRRRFPGGVSVFHRCSDKFSDPWRKCDCIRPDFRGTVLPNSQNSNLAIVPSDAANQSAGGRSMCTPANASRSAATLAVAILVCSVVCASPACAQDSSLSQAGGSAAIELAPEIKISVERFEANLKAAVEANDLRAQALALDRLGALYFTHGDPDKALKNFQRVLAIVHKLEEDTAEATALSDIGAANFALGRNEDALDAFKQALPLWRKVRNSDHEAATLGDIGEVFRALNDQDEALHFDQKALQLYEVAGNRQGHAAVLNNIGLVYYASKDKKKALDAFQKAREIYHTGLLPSGEANALNNIGGTFNAFGETRKSLEPFQQALAIQRQLGDRKGEATTLNNLGTAYSHLGDSRRALELYELAGPAFQAAGDKAGEKTVARNIEQLYADRRNRASLGEKPNEP